MGTKKHEDFLGKLLEGLGWFFLLSLIVMCMAGIALTNRPGSSLTVGSCIYYTNPDGSKRPGCVNFRVRDQWDNLETIFFDFGFDGTLDLVRPIGKQDIEPNSPTWGLWTARYLKIRQEATTGIVAPEPNKPG